MKKFKLFINDVLYVSKVTKTSKKKILILLAVLLSQLSAVADISIILFFSYIITDNITSNQTLYPILLFIFSKPALLPLFIVLRYIFNYFQIMIIKNLELNVQKNLKVHLLSEIFNKRNYSVADAYFYINTLTTHISFFYSSFTSFLNYFLQTLAFTIYLFLTNSEIMSSFLIGVFVLSFPLTFLLKKARQYMHDSYVFGQDSNIEIQRVVENMFLIKLLNKEKEEINRFSKTLEKYNFSLYNNHKFGIINSFLPSFLTLLILSIATVFLNLSKVLTLDIIGVSLRLFQSLGNLTTSVNQIINSHVHLEKFYEIEKNKVAINKENFEITSDYQNHDIVNIDEVSFKYINSDDLIFHEVNLNIKKNSHTILTGQNGSGKSTLLGLIAGVYYPTSGKIKNNAKKLGYVGATPLIFTASLKENILYGNDKKVSDDHILEVLRKFKIFNEDNKYNLDMTVDNKSLSTGQTQKIAFVRALLLDVDLLLLDESTANLYDYSRELIFQILKDNKITILNSTHNPELFKDADHHISIKIENNSRKLEKIK